MYRSHTNDRGRRDNGRHGSGYRDNRYDSDYNSYSGPWRTQEDRYEDDRYHMSRTSRLQDEDDYGPFSNIYDDNSEYRGDFDTRYNTRENYYYDQRRGVDRSDEARGQSLSDVFSGGRKRGNSDREYFTSYRSGNRYDSDPHYSLYGSEDSARYNRNHYNNDDRNMFERAGDRIRDTWNEWREDRHQNDRNNRNEDRYRDAGYGRENSRNVDSIAYNKRRRYNEGYLY